MAILGKQQDRGVMGYWNERFRRDGKIWGDTPSITIDIAVRYFTIYKIHDVLVPGSGYGRHTEFFAKFGFNVFGIDSSEVAYQMAEHHNREKGFAIKYKLGDVLEMPYKNESFEGVYCFNTLHFFMDKERKKIIDNVHRVLKKGGIAIFTVFSDKDLSFGRGQEVEPNTFESKKGRPAHYFTAEDLNNHFSNFLILENNVVEEFENHGGGLHTHFLRLIVLKKD
jgi:SAM-dependent methyltransferase